MSFKVNRSIFREYDIRGIADKEFTNEFVYRLGLAYADLLYSNYPSASRGELTVSVGRDCRLTGERIATQLTAGLRSAGVNVITLGVCPTPLTYFSIHHLKLDGGIMVTGSHNPSDYNGFKLCIGTSTRFGKDIQKLRELMESDSLVDPKMNGNLDSHPIIKDYIEHVLKITPALKKKKIVLDAGNGTAGCVAPELFQKLGADMIPLYCEMDGTFPNHHPDPTVPENLKDLQKMVIEQKADLGIGFDGDADRIGMVDEKGNVIYGDELMVIFSRDVLKEIPGATIISEVKSSHRLYQDIAKRGGKPIMWKTGHSLIKSKMKETGAALAGEMSGHIFFADRYFGYDDAVYAAVRVFEIAAKHDKPFSTLIEDLEPVIATPEIRIDCEEELKFKLVDAAKDLLKDKYEMNDIDGFRIDFGDAWGLCRASNTQPVLVLRYEAVNDKRMKEVRSVVEGALNQAAESIGHAKVI